MWPFLGRPLPRLLAIELIEPPERCTFLAPWLAGKPWKPCRFIEPIARQAEAIACAITQHAVEQSNVHRMPLVRLKTRSAPMTLRG